MDTSSPTHPGGPMARGLFDGRINRNALLVAGGLALTGLGIAAGVAWHPAAPTEIVSPGSPEATRASLASNEAVVEPSTTPEKLGTPVPTVDATPTPPATSARPAKPSIPQVPARRTAPHRAVPSTAPSYANSSGTQSAPSTQTAAVCARCGVVESVHEVTVKGKGTGLGAVAGGVLGGALGNQMGRGNGRAAMTVLGAIGGGLAGNEVEKRTRAEKFYDVTVKMDDGSVRTIRQKTALAAGSRVTIDNNVIHLVPHHA